MTAQMQHTSMVSAYRMLTLPGGPVADGGAAGLGDAAGAQAGKALAGQVLEA